ncbi:MAG: hypothetical protein IBJ11_11275 [Phycisphaerales bacterium]|nr:hypothetical protein [Phycisphaerales bacterium]
MLRLAGDGPAAPGPGGRAEEAQRRVARANAAAAALEPSEARRMIASAAAAALQGGRAAILTPERRERLRFVARALGVRAFDANVIIALVQDRARRGEIAADTPAAQPPPAAPQARAPMRRAEVLSVIAAVALAAVAVLAAVRWLGG